MYAVFTRGTIFVTSCLLYCMPTPKKGVYSKKKEFAPTGSKFFPFRVDPFSEVRQYDLTELPPIKVSPFPFREPVSLSVFGRKLKNLHSSFLQTLSMTFLKLSTLYSMCVAFEVQNPMLSVRHSKIPVCSLKRKEKKMLLMQLSLYCRNTEKSTSRKHTYIVLNPLKATFI